MDSIEYISNFAQEHPARSLLLFIVTVQFLSVVLRTLLSSRDAVKKLPTPSGASWLWGHEKLAFEQSFGVAYANWFKGLNTYVFKMRGALFRGDIIVISDPLALAHIQQRNTYAYPRSEPVRRRIGRMLGKSFGWVPDEDGHKRMRQLVSPAFSPEVLKESVEGIYAAVDGLHSRLEKFLTANNGSAEVNIQEWINRATLDVIGRFGFGHDFGGGHNEDGDKIISVWTHQSKTAMSTAGFMAIHILSRLPILNSLPLKVIKAQSEVRMTIHRGVGQELLRRQQDYSSRRKDLLSLLANAVNKGDIETQEMLDHVSMIIMAGYETTSQTVCYALWELAKQPDVQEKLRAECVEYGGEPTFDDLWSSTKMPYLDAVLRETLRLHSAVPTLERQSCEEDVIPLRHPLTLTNGSVVHEIRIKPWTTVLMPIVAINRQDAVWGDGTTFRPDRWLTPGGLPPDEMLTGGWGKTLAFSDGNRNCIGYKLAILEAKVLLFQLLKSYAFEDTGVQLKQRLASSLQSVVVGDEAKGPQLPLKVKML